MCVCGERQGIQGDGEKEIERDIHTQERESVLLSTYSGQLVGYAGASWLHEVQGVPTEQAGGES